MTFLSLYRDPIIVAVMAVMLAACLFFALRNLKWHSIRQIHSKRGLLPLNLMVVAGHYARHKKIFMVCTTAGLGLVFYLIFKNIVFSAILGICAAAVIDELITGIDKKNHVKLHMQLIGFISHMTLMLKAGKTVRQVFKRALVWTKNPLKDHLEMVVNELESGISFDEAMDNFSNRCASREVKLLASALKINHQIGGDLIFVLEKIMESLRHSLESKSKAKTLTLQSQYSATIISFFPIAALVVLYFLMTDRVTAFFSSRFANVILIAGGFLEITGIMVMKKILGAGR